jgi:hypothetical protein
VARAAAGLEHLAGSACVTALTDGRGIVLSAAVPEAVAAAERALWRMMSFEDTPVADLDCAIALDPAWPLPHAMKAGFLLGLTEPSLAAAAEAPLALAARLAAERGTERERAHVAAVTALRDGDWQGAADRWTAISDELPRMRWRCNGGICSTSTAATRPRWLAASNGRCRHGAPTIRGGPMSRPCMRSASRSRAAMPRRNASPGPRWTWSPACRGPSTRSRT